jgi:hypothetical protein
MFLYQSQVWVRAYSLHSLVERTGGGINMRSLKNMISKSESMTNTNRFARGRSSAESGVEHNVPISSKILSTFRGKQTGRG